MKAGYKNKLMILEVILGKELYLLNSCALNLNLLTWRHFIQGKCVYLIYLYPELCIHCSSLARRLSATNSHIWKKQPWPSFFSIPWRLSLPASVAALSSLLLRPILGWAAWPFLPNVFCDPIHFTKAGIDTWTGFDIKRNEYIYFILSHLLVGLTFKRVEEFILWVVDRVSWLPGLAPAARFSRRQRVVIIKFLCIIWWWTWVMMRAEGPANINLTQQTSLTLSPFC